ncbi:MAG: zf-HC2 domain-containing protein [Anaerolineae bacterium]
MKARKVQHLSTERLSAYLDGQVTPQERREVESHLRTCPQCAWELESLRHTVSLLRQVRQVAVPHPLTLREMDVRPVRTPQQAWFLPYLQGATALVSLLLVVLVAGDLLLGLGGAPTAKPQAYPAPVVATVPVEVPAPPEGAPAEATEEVALALAPAAPETPAEEALPTEERSPKAAEGGEAVPSGEAVPGGEGEATPSPSPAMRALGETTTPPVPWPPGDMGGMGGLAPAGPPTEEGPVAALAAETPTPTATPTAVPSPTPTPAPATAVAMAPAVATATPEAAPRAAVATPSPVPLPAPAEEAARAGPAPWVPWVRLAELGLLGASLVLGGLTLLLRRR